MAAVKQLDATTTILVLDTGDEALATLLAFAREQRITAAKLQAIGAFREATIAYWNAETKQYEDIPVPEQVEVLSFLGDLTSSDAGPKVHVHVTLGRRGGNTVGGHLRRGVVHPTLELFVTRYDAVLRRARDDATGLELIAIDDET
jgi:predicted DNA-binding protein with PD1-like motif